VFTTPFGSGDVVVIVGPLTTLIVAVPLATPLTLELAVMCAVPTATPVTVTITELWFCGINTLCGTVATFGASETSVTVMPPAGAVPGAKVSVRGVVPPAPNVTVCGEKLRFAATVTVALPLT
jgi:hypothetical protein